MPYTAKRAFKSVARQRAAHTRTTRRAYGSATHGYQNMAMRRMQGPPAALYPRVPTNAMALKCVDQRSAGAVQASTAPDVLVVPLLGSAFFNRLSNRTRGVSLQLTGFISPTTTNAGFHNQEEMRIVIYYDRQPNGANPSQADILTDTTPAGTAVAVTPQSGLNINNRDRFMILRDRKVMLPAVGIAGVAFGNIAINSNYNDLGKGSMNYQEFIKLKGLESLYNSANGGTVGDISAGAFGILVFNDDATGDPAWNFTLQARFKFLD